MEHQIKILIASVGFTLWFITFANLPHKLRLAFKPFNCEVCLPIYITIVLLFLPMIVAEVVALCTWGSILSAYIAHELNEN